MLQGEENSVSNLSCLDSVPIMICPSSYDVPHDRHIFSFQTLQMSSTQTCNTVFPTLCQLRIYSSRDQNSKIHQIQTGFCAQVSNPAFCLICASCTRVFVFSCRTDNSSLPAFHSDCNLWSLQDVSLSAHTASQLQWKRHLHCAARVL